jgi:alpha-L-fucosidase
MLTVLDYQPEDTRQARLHASPEGLRQFVDAGFGLTVHWGLYALGHSSNEWAYFNERIAYPDYQERMHRFNPLRFSADEWGDLLVEMGAKFFFITSKHHDGFCLYDTAHTEFSVMHSAFGRDIIGELARALQVRGIALHFYYSLVDWTHPAYRHDWPAYVAFYQNQVRELCTNYGKVGGFVFDGYWPRNRYENADERDYFGARGAWDLAGTYDLIHSLQPDALISNNHHILPLNGEDYQVCELDLPGENTTGFNTAEIGNLPMASWWNLNTGWSYQPWNHQPKSTDQLWGCYRQVRERKAVFMLNVGPRAFGDIHPDEARVLREFGSKVRAAHL